MWRIIRFVGNTLWALIPVAVIWAFLDIPLDLALPWIVWMTLFVVAPVAAITCLLYSSRLALELFRRRRLNPKLADDGHHND